ncbi:MAG: segregation and condensation protein A [Candidatus Methanofastidiosum methylothiophilum]|jgi:segregation and condensation protein A|uniref:Segregation and condensation protein A n=1 Tax=Candidatus Methanofastidiosum methylothiophilum TaxID=1705564 RepID=A0A150JL95_9EURY|nr:MAG: segregation and condensation protein A [Candidatus Methanofastidiosum methylthiophilus]MBP6932740.1 segregation/condensation protein A [Methanofastidiosum sp.]OQC49857.1 MAG: segregation and condensation protein A [Euryarchaeota archaeon ADurb.Bin023]KYC56957.1 MAG: segregation and condensation protein A [Candidatus Methanofastidiosum methylthiophilus]KYC58019.1 MAG: segregation and condensation protein A [Candidatus Methanofastidiosum methylthiophilus]
MDLVLSREIDPWDIDIIDLTNKFLERIRKLKNLDLRISGKTILTASILLRMKSEQLMKEEQKEEIDDEFFDFWEDIENAEFEIDEIKPPLRRRNVGKMTLPELFEALIDALEEGEKPKRKIIAKVGPQLYQIDEIKADIRKQVEKLYQYLLELKNLNDTIYFKDLLIEKTTREVARLFLYILFLYSDKKIEILQEVMFGEILIKVL